METISYFDQEYIKNAPLRISAAKKYYLDRPQFETLEEARTKKQKYGNWIILVQIEGEKPFYTMTTFKEKWVRAGDVYGIWNELKLIENTK